MGGTLVIAAALLIAGPSRASAATQVGETFTPPSGATNSANPCSGGWTFLQSGSPNGQYTVPFAGVITSWSFAANNSPPQQKLKLARPAGGDSFTIVGESAQKAPLPNQLNTYTDVRITVQAGDIIGFFIATSGDCAYDHDPPGGAGYSYHQLNADPSPGTMPSFQFVSVRTKLDLSAILEPDCDNDGFGDETQDPDLSSCGPGTGGGTGQGTGPAPTLPS